MARLIVTINGEQAEIQTGIGGRFDGDPSGVIWCWDKDGEPPVVISLGYMERIEKIELIKDANGKQQYDTIVEGDNKSETKKAPARQLVVYLRNNRLGKTARSSRKPLRLPPEA
jgi:hypothetical protein